MRTYTRRVAHSSGNLVGRERELAELRHGLQGALTGRGGLFMVAGDPGVGKTALADEIGAEAVAAGALVLWGRAWEGGGAPAYWPWVRIIRRLAAERDVGPAIQALGPEARARLANLVPDLVPSPDAAPPGAASPDPSESDTGRFQVFDAVTSLLRAAAQDGALVLILDDLHGADQPSLRLLAFLAVHLRDSPILVVGTYREAEARLDAQLAATLGEILRHGQRLPLRGLRERDVAEVVERVAGRRPPDRVVRAIHAATEGNPFFVDEVVRLLSAEGRLDSEEQVAALRIPDGVRETIRHRLAPLPERARELLRTAAVIGREFRLDTLQHVSELEPADLDTALGEAVELGVVIERPAAIGAYAFSHGLIRETLYDDIGPQRRGRLHRDVGLTLEDLYAADPDPHVSELAHHFFVAATAGELTKAIDYAVRAGERAMELVAYEEASEHFERALQAFGLQDQADVPRRCDLLLALATAQSRAGNTRSARETFLRAAFLARRLESPEQLARAALGYGAGMGGFEFGLVDDTLIDLLQEAREALGPRDGPLQARVLGRMATELYYSDRTLERAQLSEAAVAMARRLGDRGTVAATLSARFLTLWGPENSVERLRIATDIVALGEDARDRELVLRGHFWRIVSLMELGDWVGADIELAIHARLADDLRDPLHMWQVPLYEANRAMMDGRLHDAERASAEAFAIGRVAQPQNAAQLYAVQLFSLRAVQGRLVEVQQSVEEFARRYPAAPVWRAATAYTMALLGRRDGARRTLEALTADGLVEVPRDGEWMSTVALLISTAARLGDKQRCEQLGALIDPYLHLAVIAGRGATCFGPVSRYAGMAAAAAGHFDAAIGHYESALETGRRWGTAPFVAVIGLELADVLEKAAATSEATAAGAAAATITRARIVALRRECIEISRRLGLVGLVARWQAVADVAAGAAPPEVDGAATGAYPNDRAATAARTNERAATIAAATPPADALAFYRRGDVWTIGAPGSAVQLRHAKGLTHIRRLLAAPRVEFHALDLVTAPDRGTSAAVALVSGMEVRGRGSGDTGPALDSQAKAAYRARIDELQAEIDEAASFNDPERLANAREELAFLARELAGAVGLGGRDRKTGSDAERARVNATRAIRTALKRIAEHAPALGGSLGAAIKTGVFCVYEPPAGDEPEWDFDGPS